MTPEHRLLEGSFTETKFDDAIACSCGHGAKLEGASGPALSSAAWQQRFGGATLLRVWGAMKGPLAEYAGTTKTHSATAGNRNL